MLNRTRGKAENLLDRFSPTPYSSAPLPPRGKAAKQYGEVSEWLKEHAWKVCIRQRIEGSNPSLTAIFEMRARTKVRAFFFYILPRGRDENPRPRVRQLAQPVGQTANAVSGLPAGRAKRVNPSRCYMQHRAVWKCRVALTLTRPTKSRPGLAP